MSIQKFSRKIVVAMIAYSALLIVVRVLFGYDDATIQKSINDKFSSEMKLTTQKNENERIVSEAQAMAEANRILSESLTDEVLKQQYYEKWDGKLPSVMADSNGIIIDP